MSELSSAHFDPMNDVARPRAAYEQTTEERNALTKEELLPVNIEVPAAVIAVMGRADEILAMRPRAMDEFKKFDVSWFDKLHPYALAMWHAHTKYLTASSPPEQLPAALQGLVRTHGIFYTDLQALVARELLNGELLAGMRGTKSHQYIPHDVFLMAEVARSHWNVIEGKTALTMAELNTAEADAHRVAVMLSEREQAPQNHAAAREQWQRAFTLFIRCYKQVVRAVRFIDEENLDSIVPQIYAVRGPAKKKGQPELPGSGDPIELAPAPGATAPAAIPAAPTAAVAPGMPGADPFIRSPQ